MSKYSEHPVLWINQWITEELRSSGIIPAVGEYVTDVDTNNAFETVGAEIAVPFLSPGGQRPETLTTINNGSFTSLPIGVYTFSQFGSYDEPWNKSGQVSYILYFGDVDKLIEMGNFLEDLTAREDDSATDINYFFRNDPTYPYDFKSLCFDTGVGPYPPDDEGGRYRYLVVIKYSASYEGINRVDDYSAETGKGRI